MKKLSMIFLALVVFSAFAIASPEGVPPKPWWSPCPTTNQEYISAICGSGDPVYQQWCSWLSSHPSEVPSNYLCIVPEFSGIAAIAAITGAGLGFLVLRKSFGRKNRK